MLLTCLEMKTNNFALEVSTLECARMRSGRNFCFGPWAMKTFLSRVECFAN